MNHHHGGLAGTRANGARHRILPPPSAFDQYTGFGRCRRAAGGAASRSAGSATTTSVHEGVREIRIDDLLQDRGEPPSVSSCFGTAAPKRAPQSAGGDDG